MAGPIEVQQVTHIFSREEGFITEVLPDMCVTINEYSTATILNAMQYAMGGVWGKLSRWYPEETKTVEEIADSAKTSAAAAIATYAGLKFFPGHTFALTAIGSVAVSGILLGGIKILKFTQDRQPILIHPLMLGGKFLVAGVDGYKQDGVLANLLGDLEPFWYEQGGFDVWAKKMVRETTGSLTDSLYRFN
jgi:hypothetical protein